MITPKEAMENPELMIKHKDDLKDVEIFKYPSWYRVFEKYPYLYREFSDRFDEMDGEYMYCALVDDPTLISDLKEYLHKMSGEYVSLALREDPAMILYFKDYLHKMGYMDEDWLVDDRPEMFLCIKYKDNPDKAEAAYYIGYPHKLDDLNDEEEREMGKRITELLEEEKEQAVFGEEGGIMITVEYALKNPELMIKYKNRFKNIELFEDPWHEVFLEHRCLYKEFPDRFDEMSERDIACAIFEDLTMASELKEHLHKLTKDEIADLVMHNSSLTLDLKDYLYKLDKKDVDRVSNWYPNLSLCLKHKDDPDRVEAAHYILFPDKLINMNKEEKREIGKRILALLREEKI